MFDKRRLCAALLLSLCVPLLVLPLIWGWITLSGLAMIVIPIIVSSLITGAAFLLRSSEADYRRKRDIWEAIRKWVELPDTPFRGQRDTLPLAEKPPELADGVEGCLKRKYPSIWADLQKLRQEYSEYKMTNVSAKFTKDVNGRDIVNLEGVKAYDRSMCSSLKQLHDQLREHIKSEILDKHDTELKC